MNIPSRPVLAALAAALLSISRIANVTAGTEAAWPDLSESPAATGGGEKDAAVVVGIDRYGYVAPVPGAARNAEDWYSYFTKGLKIPVDRVTLLRDNQGTLEKMRRFGQKAAKSVEPGGTLWFVFVGHGAPGKDGKDGLLVGTDAQQEAESLYARSLPRRELLTLLAKGRQENTVVLLDACFSGRAPDGAPLVAGLQPLVAVAALPAAVGSKTVILTAARSDQFAGSLPGARRPAFSYLALGALRGWGDDKSGGGDGNGKTTAGEAVAYARKALSALASSLSATAQEPELSSGNPDLALGAGREPGPDLAAMVLQASPSASKSESPSQDKTRLPRTAPAGLIYEELVEGSGPFPAATDKVKVHYKGWLENGTVFDSSYDRGEPAEFPLNGVIACWTQGVQKMRPGGKARLTCPSFLAYGERGVPPTIPPGATLNFEVELLDIVSERPQRPRKK